MERKRRDQRTRHLAGATTWAFRGTHGAMGERKVINKYYPPDFDPEAVSKIRRGKDKQTKVRMMLPMSVRCSSCGNFVYRGTKFNSKKETVEGEDYLGIRLFRFYFNCPNCSATLAMKTDPKNSDYVMEFGATRNNDPWQPTQEEREIEEAQPDEELMDKMELLEKQARKRKEENDIMTALDEMKVLRAEQERTDLSHVLSSVHDRKAGDSNREEEDIEEELQEMMRLKQDRSRLPEEVGTSGEGDPEPDTKRARGSEGIQGWLGGVRNHHAMSTDRSKGAPTRVRKVVIAPSGVGRDNGTCVPACPGPTMAALHAYGSEEDSE